MALKLGRKREGTKARVKRPVEKLIKSKVAGTEQLLTYPAFGVVTCRLLIDDMQPGNPEVAWDRRYENARAAVADWISACRRADRRAFSRTAFDVWINEDFGRTRASSMMVTVAGTGGLPTFHLLEVLRERPNAASRHWEWGRQPIALGAFPELHVAGGTVAHTWSLDVPFLTLASERFRRWHELAPEVSDPYRQMASGASEPIPFEWTPLREETEPRQSKVFLFEVVTDSEERKGLRVSSPEQNVSVGDVYDLQDQLQFANVDITGDSYEPFQRLQYVRYVRPALRALCGRFGRSIPDWLADDSIFDSASPASLMDLFGAEKLGIRPFQPLRKFPGGRVEVANVDAAHADEPSEL